MRHRPVDFDLYLITDRKQAKGALLEAVEQALLGGVTAIQLREKDLSGGELYRLALEARELTLRYGARLLINDRVDVAAAVDADGVHLGTAGIPAEAARRVLGDSALIGVSCHDLESAVAAQESGADFITYGPVFHTPSKAQYGDPVGVESLRKAMEAVSIPIFALGGIGIDTIGTLTRSGIGRIAMISAIIAAEDPRTEAERIIRSVSAAHA